MTRSKGKFTPSEILGKKMTREKDACYRDEIFPPNTITITKIWSESLDDDEDYENDTWIRYAYEKKGVVHCADARFWWILDYYKLKNKSNGWDE